MTLRTLACITFYITLTLSGIAWEYFINQNGSVSELINMVTAI